MFNYIRIGHHLSFIKVCFLLTTFIPLIVFGHTQGIECVAFRDMGKFCYPLIATNSPPLLVFIRGLYQGSGHVESINTRMIAANLALEAYQLNSFERPVIVLGSSHLGLDQSSILEIEALYQKYNLGEFKQYSVASHSGGYAGLFKTLREALAGHIPMPKTLIMLDNFYSVQPVNIETYQKVLEHGVSCGGFLTTHNLDRYQRLYKNSKCSVIGPEGQNHNSSVVPTLNLSLGLK